MMAVDAYFVDCFNSFMKFFLVAINWDLVVILFCNTLFLFVFEAMVVMIVK